MIMQTTRRRFALCVIAALCAASTLSGCGRTNPPVRVDDVVEMTEETLTDLLLGNGRNLPVTSTAPVDKPLMQKDVYETALIAADEQGFEKMSRGSLKAESIREIEARVVRTVNKNIAPKGFAARLIAFPPPPDVATQDKTLLVTLTPATQETGSPKDRAENKADRLILVRLLVTDPRTGATLAERDYYSGADVRRDTPQRRMRIVVIDPRATAGTRP